MTDKNPTEKTSCGCKTTCDLPQSNNIKPKNKGIFGLLAAMALCCIAPFGLAIFAGSVSLMPLLVWSKNPTILALVAISIAASVWLLVKFRRKQT